jgi:hypothetical protein
VAYSTSVFKDLQISLYDIFGYLLPGAVILLAAILLFWTLFWPNASLTFPSALPFLASTFLLFAAYLAGHLGQALGNLLEKLSKARVRLDNELPVSLELGKMVLQAAADRFGEHAKTFGVSELFHLCDQTLVHNCSPGEREIFTYREGFYRGNSVALTFVSLALVARLVSVPAIVVIAGKSHDLYRGPLALAAVLTGVGAWLCYSRFLRFAKHRYRSCFLRFLALSKGPATGTRRSHE